MGPGLSTHDGKVPKKDDGLGGADLRAEEAGGEAVRTGHTRGGGSEGGREPKALPLPLMTGTELDEVPVEVDLGASFIHGAACQGETCRCVHGLPLARRTRCVYERYIDDERYIVLVWSGSVGAGARGGEN